MLRCVGTLQANYVRREIHMGFCGMHVGPRAVVRKVIRQGYYWPTMHEDAKEEVQKCDSCQIHASMPRLTKTLMTSIMAPWPFYQWGMDILGPLPPARGGAKFVIVAVDYFTKWFGLPQIIVTDNGAQLKRPTEASWKVLRHASGEKRPDESMNYRTSSGHIGHRSNKAMEKHRLV
ncbi:reverse transcriptase domain-containing protein [Tanacetum coccineum]